MNIKITLEWYEAEQAIIVGGRREAELIRKGVDTKRQFSKQSSIDNHIQSAGAEKAVGKCLNIDWHASINTFKDGVPDVGQKIEVRYRRNCQDLKVTKEDQDDRCYVLVWGELPHYEIVGWLWGKDAKQPQWWMDPGEHDEPAFFVPPKHLHPVEKLTVSRISLEANT